MTSAKKILNALLITAMLATSIPACADDTATPPELPAMTQGQPPEGMGAPPNGQPPMGTPPSGGPGGQMGTPPDGAPGGMMGGPGGGSSQPESYDAVVTVSEGETAVTEDIASTGTDENALLVDGGSATADGVTITRESSDSTGGDSASFYGVGAAVLVTDGDVTVENATITTDAAGGAGVFAYGSGVATVKNTAITTKQGTSGGIHVAGGGTLVAENCTVETYGGSAAAIRSDRGSGSMTVSGGTYTAHGSGSPAVYVTADISIENAELNATGSEALCLEGLNAVRLYNCTLTGSMPDQEQNDNTWTVILYQSMSGDAQVGEGSFLMDGGSLISENGGLFYTTNTDSVFTLRNVSITAADDCEYFLRVTGNSNQRGWGASGANGANCVFTGIAQEMNGDILWDSISTLNLYVTEGSVLTGAVIDDETHAGSGGDGSCTVTIDAASTWVVTSDSTVTTLHCAGTIVDVNGASVTIRDANGAVLQQGNSLYTITVDSFDTEADCSGAGTVDTFAEHRV